MNQNDGASVYPTKQCPRSMILINTGDSHCFMPNGDSITIEREGLITILKWDGNRYTPSDNSTN